MEKINRLEITARYAETDMMGIIHHSVYPVWFEAARTEFIKMTGITYSELEKQGIISREDNALIQKGLDSILEDIENGSIEIYTEYMSGTGK